MPGLGNRATSAPQRLASNCAKTGRCARGVPIASPGWSFDSAQAIPAKCSKSYWTSSIALWGEVAGEIENEVGGVGGEGIDDPIRGEHDGHVRGDSSVTCIQGRD